MLKVKHVLRRFYWAADTGRWAALWWDWAILQQGCPSSPKPARLTWACGETAAALPACVCLLPLLSLSWPSSQRRTWVHSWEARVAQKTGKLGERLGRHASSCGQALKQGWEVKVIFSPAEPKASHSPPGTSNSAPGPVGTDTNAVLFNTTPWLC